jgi:hypothetical protein
VKPVPFTLAPLPFELKPVAFKLTRYGIATHYATQRSMR